MAIPTGESLIKYWRIWKKYLSGRNAGRDREGHCAGGCLGGRGARRGGGRAVRDDDRIQIVDRSVGVLQGNRARAVRQHGAVPAIWQNQY